MRPEDTAEEYWKEVEEAPGYWLSSLGRVWSEKRDIVMKPGHSDLGYVYFTAKDREGKQRYFSLHRMLYKTFICEIPKGYDIHHLDHNRNNNVLGNLSAISHKQNCLERSKNTKIFVVERDYDRPGRPLKGSKPGERTRHSPEGEPNFWY